MDILLVTRHTWLNIATLFSSSSIYSERSEVSQLCLTLCDPVNCSLPGSSVHGIPRQEYWSGLPCPPPGSLPNPGTEPASLMSLALAGRFFTTSATQKAHP